VETSLGSGPQPLRLGMELPGRRPVPAPRAEDVDVTDRADQADWVDRVDRVDRVDPADDRPVALRSLC
jgi:hypothetical protein